MRNYGMSQTIWVDGPSNTLVRPEDPAANWQRFTLFNAREQMGEVLRLVAKLVIQFGDTYRDPRSMNGVGCEYVSNGGDKPSCLVGQILYYLGFPSWNMVRGPISGYARTGLVLGEATVPVAVTTVVLMAAMQGAQDGGATWQQAQSAGEQARNALVHLPL